MRKLILFNVLVLYIMLLVVCKGKEVEGPLAQYNEKQQNIIMLRMNYELSIENWIIQSDTQEIIMNLKVKNNAKKGRLNYLTAKIVQYDNNGNPLKEGNLTLDVSPIKERDSKTFLLRYPDTVEGVEGLSVEIVRYPDKKRLKDYKEFP